jgi:hypothetical protein
MEHMAIDVGFGGTKAVASNGRKASFISVVGDFHPVAFVSGMNDATSNLVIDYNSRKSFVGESALKQSIPRATVDTDRTVTDEGMTLLAAAMALLAEGPATNTNMVVGLPVRHYETLKNQYLKQVHAIHAIDLLTPTGGLIERKFVSVEQARVLPQPFGAFFDLILDDKGKLTSESEDLANGKVGIVDIGYNTLDLARADQLEYINPRSTSFAGQGIFSAFQALSSELYRSFKVEIPPERIEPIVRSGRIKVAGKETPIFIQQETAFKEAAAQIISRIKSLWPDRWELDRILLAGGGSILLGKYLQAEFSEQAVIAADPAFANVNGYLKFARRVWK